MTNVCISNVPGPQEQVFMNGARAVGNVGLGPLADRMGLFIVVTSYSGKISFCVTSCRRTMPDIEFFMDCMRDSFAELKRLSQEIKTPRRRKTKKKSIAKKIADKKKTSHNRMPEQKPVAKKKQRKKAARKAPVLPKKRKKRTKKVSAKQSAKS
jgi:hypothetical protein